MYETFGAGRQDDGSHGFRLFVPDNAIDPGQYGRGGACKITEVRAVGDFQQTLDPARRNWSYADGLVLTEQPHPHGRLFAATLPPDFPDGYYQYKYVVTFRNGSVRWVGDPCTKYGGTGHNNSAFVKGGTPLQPPDPPAQRRPWQDLVIYELMIDDFTAEYRQGRAPIDAVVDKLDYLAGQGFNAIEFLPWVAWPDEEPYSWGYDPAYYFSVESLYVHVPGDEVNRLARLTRLVSECHRRGLQVLLDVVLQHAQPGPTDSGFAYYWLWQQPDESPFVGPFTDAAAFGSLPLDYNNACTQQFAVDVCAYWADRFGLDGLRFDEASGFRRPDKPALGLPAVVRDLKARLAGAGRDGNFALVLEDTWDFEAVHTTNVVCASNCWFDVFRARAADYLAPWGRADPRFLRVLNAGKDFAAGKGPVTYLENHDHMTVTFVAGGRERWYRVQPYVIALYTCPGAVQVNNGQEFGRSEYLPEDDSRLPADQKRVRPRPLRWAESDDATGRLVRAKYALLARIRREHPGLRTANFYPDSYDESWSHFSPEGYGIDVDKQVVIYHRWGPAADGRLERFMVVLNFSDSDQYVDVPFAANGTWQELLGGRPVQVDGYRLRDFRVSSNWGCVFCQKA
jgi:1,4-alpha-glucan branching enzyme